MIIGRAPKFARKLIDYFARKRIDYAARSYLRTDPAESWPAWVRLVHAMRAESRDGFALYRLPSGGRTTSASRARDAWCQGVRR